MPKRPGRLSSKCDCLGAIHEFDTVLGLAYHDVETALDGELAVPCTRNPL